MILVDETRHHRSGWWCHMVSDRSVEELHAFASEIGLRRRWFQDGPRPHYDLRPSKRRLAVAKGAKEVNVRVLVRRMARLEHDFHPYCIAFRSNHRPKRQTRRCPNLRGPT